MSSSAITGVALPLPALHADVVLWSTAQEQCAVAVCAWKTPYRPAFCVKGTTDIVTRQALLAVTIKDDVICCSNAMQCSAAHLLPAWVANFGLRRVANICLAPKPAPVASLVLPLAKPT